MPGSLTEIRSVSISSSGKADGLPSCRRHEIDLVEEIARIHGVDNIPTLTPSAKIIPGSNDSRTRAITALRDRLQGLGVSEIMNYTLVNNPLLDLFNKENTNEREELPQPVVPCRGR